MKFGVFSAFFALFLPISAFAQCPPTSEEEFAKIYEAMLSQCNEMKGIVPCAIGIGVKVAENSAYDEARLEASVNLAKQVDIFIKETVKNSEYSKDMDVQKVSEKVKKTKTELRLSGIAEIASKCGDTGKLHEGKNIYKVIMLAAIHKDLYNEARAELLPESPEISFLASAPLNAAATGEKTAREPVSSSSAFQSSSSLQAKSSSSASQAKSSSSQASKIDKNKVLELVKKYTKKAFQILIGIII
jgi:hypothetical protein